tara:strand:+ start:234 stop:1880 length:1647 start_codon:yes stop_codon:yes gene_type:complete
MADRVVAATDTLNYFRHEFNGTAEDVGAIADILSASGIIASATDVVESITLLNTDLTAITTDAHIFGGGSIVFEGDTDDSYETTLAITDPTADRTLTLPNLTGTATSITGTQTLANKTFTSPAINAGTLSGAFTGTMDITGTVLSGASPLVFEGASADAYETTLAVENPAADRTVSLPNATDTLIGKATTDTLTNKSIDLENNTFTGSVAEFNSALQSDSFTSLTGTETLENKTFTSPTISGGTFSGSFTGTMDFTSTVLSGASPLVFEGATADAYETTLAFVDPTADRTITFFNATDTLVGRATTDTLTNKTIDLGGPNTFTGSLAEWNSALQSASFVSLTGSETLENKTLTSPTINGGTFSGSFTGTMDISGTVLSGTNALVFEGATADAYETTWAFTDPTADRVITFFNATDTVVGKATTDTLTNKTVDLANNTLTGSVAEFNAALQSESFATLTGSETLENKTFTSPIINTMTFSSGQLSSGLSIGATGIIFEGATADAYETTLTVTDPTADRTLTIPNETATLASTGTYTTKAQHIAKCIAMG